MRRIFPIRAMPLLLICSLVLVSSSPAQAACDTEETATEESTCVVMVRGETKGIWFSLDEAEKLRRLKLEVPELRFQVERYQTINNLQIERMEIFELVAGERSEMFLNAQDQLDESLQREIKMRQQLNVWYRSPALWFSSGAVLATIAYVAVIFGVGT